jgi:hypothetical protein
VLQDIEDAILLSGFEGMDHKAINSEIHSDLAKRREYSIVLKKTENEEDAFKLQDENRNFLNRLMRPPISWNFFEDGVVKTPHVLRAEA